MSSFSLVLVTVWLIISNRVAATRTIQNDLPDGVTIQCQCGGPAFIMQSGKARMIPDEQTYRLLGYKSPRRLTKAKLDMISNFGDDFPHLDSNLILDSQGTVYLVRGGWKWGIPGDIWNELLAKNPLILDRNKIQKVDGSIINRIPGYEITAMVLSPGFTLEGGGFVIEDGKARLLPDDYTKSVMGYTEQDMLNLPAAFKPEIFKRIKGGPAYAAISRPIQVPAPSRGTSKWELDETDNSWMYVTKSTLPAGAEIRILVKGKGDGTSINLNEYVGAINNTANVIRDWNSRDLAEGQVLTYKLSKPMRIGIDVKGGNYWEKAISISETGEITTMQFGGGWNFDVKIVNQQL